MFELSQSFYFDAAHTLERTVETDSSRRIHGHTYRGEITVTGTLDPTTGMVADLGVLRATIDSIKGQLDHHLLDDIETLGAPTIENLCRFIYQQASAEIPGISSVRVWREASGDTCRLIIAADSAIIG